MTWMKRVNDVASNIPLKKHAKEEGRRLTSIIMESTICFTFSYVNDHMCRIEKHEQRSIS